MERYRKSFTAIMLLIASLLIYGCQGVALTNKTNQRYDPSGPNYAYNAASDIFVAGSSPWKYQLRVSRESNSVDLASIKPFVIIDRESHLMQISGAWNGNISYWYYDRPSGCSTGMSPAVSESQYSFSVNYTRSNVLVVAPPARIPAGSMYTSRMLNMGLGFVPTLPYPNYPYASGMIYDQNCWETGIGCAPTWKETVTIQARDWPGPPSWYEHKLALSNPESKDATITEIVLGPLGSDTASYALFEIVNTPLPIVLPACGGTAEITIRYKPGYNHPAGYTATNYNHQLLLTTKVLWAGLPTAGNGPFAWINYAVQVNPD